MSRASTAAPARRRAGAAFTVAALLLLLAGCGSNAAGVYRESAVKVLEASLSEARTAELAGRLWVAGRSTHPLAVVVVGESDTGVGAEAAWFEAQQPPTRSGDVVRAQTVEALDGATSAVQSVRIALERSDRAATRAALGELRAACTDLETLAEDLG